MKEFKDKVAVITGAASGIGLGIARRAAKEGMKVVLADIEKDALNHAEEELRASGTEVTSLVTDVSKSEAIEKLAQKTINVFGEVHLLCNNAGVAAPGPLWECVLSDYNWVIGVNLWGVIHGIRTFIPIMLKQNNECHIVNTSSMAGLLAGDPGNGIYSVTKQGVVALSESLQTIFSQAKAKICISVLCPGIVNTRITDSERNRPAEFCGPDYIPCFERIINNHPELEEIVKGAPKLWEKGTDPDQAGDVVFEAIKNNVFYIFTETGIFWKKSMKTRFEGIWEDYNKIKSILKEL
ncbi:MAG: SDR family NAD(P)-dependent oxidoreductase [Promethearchaeota archaeon]|nr:MAG: SDR family NAD(P)-dependent oxidoreductase [Candidatus Lokiarchaeota archaeon]